MAAQVAELERSRKMSSRELGELLRVCRLAASFTEEEAAEALGMPSGKVRYIELGYIEISALCFCQMLELYGWDPAATFTITTVTARQVRRRMARELRASANELLNAANELDVE